MKRLLVLVAFLVGSHGLNQDFIDSWMEKMQNYVQVCAEENHATADDIGELIELKEPSTHEGQCVIFCVQKKLHMMFDDGSIDKVGSVVALHSLHDADLDLYKKILSIFITCGEKAVIYDDPCKTGTELAKCGKVEAKTIGLDESMLG